MQVAFACSHAELLQQMAHLQTCPSDNASPWLGVQSFPKDREGMSRHLQDVFDRNLVHLPPSLKQACVAARRGLTTDNDVDSELRSTNEAVYERAFLALAGFQVNVSSSKRGADQEKLVSWMAKVCMLDKLLNLCRLLLDLLHL
jgi:hypothetical protein